MARGNFALGTLIALSTTLLLWGGPRFDTVPRRPLDLPSGGDGEAEDEEDEPESILFYGGEYEGDGFFWCLDKSCSMFGGQMDTLKAEVNAAVSSLSTRADIGLVAFSTNTITWNPGPVRATVANKMAASAWVLSLVSGGGTLIAPAGVETVELGNLSSKRSKTMIVVGDGLPADGEAALTDITNANYQNNPINTILISDTGGTEFMQALSSMNDGSFRFVP